MATKRKKKPVKRTARPVARARRQPETLRLRGISPSLTATDLQRSIAFYRDVLGFVVGETWKESGVVAGVEIRAGTVSFYLNQDDFAKGRDRKKGEGARLYCRTAQDLDRVAAQIKERGGVLDREPTDMPWGERVFMISDPDGFKLTFTQAR